MPRRLFTGYSLSFAARASNWATSQVRRLIAAVNGGGRWWESQRVLATCRHARGIWGYFPWAGAAVCWHGQSARSSPAGCVIISLLLLRPLRQRRVRHLTLERAARQEEGRQGAQHMSTAEVMVAQRFSFLPWIRTRMMTSVLCVKDRVWRQCIKI